MPGLLKALQYVQRAQKDLLTTRQGKKLSALSV